MFSWFRTPHLVVIAVLALSGCSSDIKQYQGSEPKLVLEQFFNGKLRGYGMVSDFSDDIQRKFVVDIEARWENDIGTLDEYFIFDDGEKQFRQWIITKQSENTYQGKADDVVGIAEGTQAGSVLKWQYTLALKMDESTINVNFDDTMVLIDQNHMLNVAKIYKFGLHVGTVTLSFEKL
ncbi:DUF3833 domain-containing protein [Thalassotalea aquiviva]|uniref:DUF3833 domain-containing protein n=1 Tax=Thalassotalea aquiviva TaxID=3242415 RepID=UPI00352AB4A1